MAKKRPATPRTRRTARTARPSAQTVVTIRIASDTGDGTISDSVRRDAPVREIADEWSYILRSRTRWIDDEDVRLSLRSRALDALERLGVSTEFMKTVALNTHVEVELHPWDPSDASASAVHEAASELPWEYLLSAGSRAVGRHQSMLITRLFRHGGQAVAPPPPGRMLFIDSAPGRLDDAYDFTLERVRIGAALGADDRQPASGRVMERSDTETLRQVRRRVRDQSWDVLHVTGIDTHQAAWLVDGFYDTIAAEQRTTWKNVTDADGRVRDGMILREANITELPVPYDALADALIDTKRPPSMVTLNLYYSGARTAREIVGRGAFAAMGFLDEIDDELAELFFQAFYWAWCQSDGSVNIPQAFMAAWEKMTGNSRLHGTAITIWMGHSVFERLRIRPLSAAAPLMAPEPREAFLTRLRNTPIRELLQVQVETPEEVNYSLLHNDRPLLTRLTLTKLIKEPLEDVRVLVELNLGAENYPYRCTHMVLSEPQLEIAPEVCIPLTAALPRSLGERVQSTVYVRVDCDGRVALESTRRITLIPVDEWLDDTDNNPWLPSFVLPRDPAILQIIAASRRYLIGIRDDPAAGFDGYQSIDDKADEPSEGVDAQVQAIWSALVNDYRIQYINPPPAYSEQSQRLRTPSDILASNTGTCIDLALLLASCLEYVDIYPVVVLLSGHAFVGYWRSEEAHERFLNILHVPANVVPTGGARARAAAVRFVDQYSWRLTSLHYEEIVDYVTSGDLVMLEATYLTSASSFSEAMTEGRANMRSRREFDSLLDIKLARSATPAVTPLPIIHE